MNLDNTNARAFNSSLKKAVQSLTGQKVSVEIINSYNFPRCWVRVYAETGFDNDFRLKVFDSCKLDRQHLLNPDNVSYGNIQRGYISAHVPDWNNLFSSLTT